MATLCSSALPEHMPSLSVDHLGQVDEAVWVDVIRQMDEVYARLVQDEIALEEKNTELEASQQFIYSLLSSMSDVLIACNVDGAIEQTNAALLRLVGRDDAQLQGEHIESLLCNPASVTLLRAAIASPDAQRGGVSVEVLMHDAHGQEVPVDLNCNLRRSPSGQVVGCVFVGRPLAEIKRAYRELRDTHEALKRTQAQLIHSEKLASLGRLVAGVAHELNNPISFVLGNVHALQRYAHRIEQYLAVVHRHPQTADVHALRQQLRLDHVLGDLPSLMQGTMEGAQRTADIVKGLKRFSAVDREELARIDLGEIIERAIHWVQKGTAPQFQIEFSRQPDAWVIGNGGQLLQVLMNLIQNAYDACGGQTDALPHLSIRLHRTLSQPLSVVADFLDNGSGIAPQHMARIFDPFFTTKGVGKGTGLGLSISYNIVERHGGSLVARNNEGRGACFTLTFPAA